MAYCILFSGHMIDEKKRAIPRFPDAIAGMVKDEMRKILTTTVKKIRNSGEKKKMLIKGIAGGACGGDIIFHELCLEKGIDVRSEIYLGWPIPEFKEKSVAFAGKKWIDRFELIIEHLPVHVFKIDKKYEKERNWTTVNKWMLNTALRYGPDKIMLLALWDKYKSSKKGGTQDMVASVKKIHAPIKIISFT